MRNLVCLLFAVLLACTLPKEQRGNDGFVSTKEQDAIKYVREGNYFYRQGRYVSAELKYRQANNLFPLAKNIKINLINSLIKTEQISTAADLITDLVRKDPEDLDLILLKAKLYLQQYKYEKAIKLFTQAEVLALEKNLNNYLQKIYHNLSSIYFLLGAEEKALCYAALLNDNYKTAEFKTRLARLKVALGYAVVEQNQSNSVNLAKKEVDYLKWKLLDKYAEQDQEQARLVISQIKFLRGEDLDPTPEVALIEYLYGDDSEDKKLQIFEKKIEKIFESFYQDGLLIGSIGLYWPAVLIQEIQKNAPTAS